MYGYTPLSRDELYIASNVGKIDLNGTYKRNIYWYICSIVYACMLERKKGGIIKIQCISSQAASNIVSKVIYPLYYPLRNLTNNKSTDSSSAFQTNFEKLDFSMLIQTCFSLC